MRLLFAEQFSECVFLETGTDHADLAGDIRCSETHFCLFGNIVKVDPASILIRNHSLGTKNKAVGLRIIKLSKDLSDLLLGVSGRRLHSPAREDLVRVMSAVVMVVMVMTVGFIDPVAVFIHFHFRVLVVMIVVVMMVLMLFLIVIIVVMMVVMMVLVLFLIVIIVVMMVMMMVLVLFLIVIIVVMMVMMMVLVLFFLFLLLAHELLEDLSLQIGSAFDSSEDLFAVQFSKRGRDDRCLRIVFAKDLYALSDLFLTCLVGSCEDDRACALDLVDKELAEVLHIELALGSVHNRYGGIEGHI